jgi:hypothetical protein
MYDSSDLMGYRILNIELQIFCCQNNLCEQLEKISLILFRYHGELLIASNAFYLLFGIDMICMSFNLVQEEVIKNVKDFAMKLGLIQDPENEEE